MEEEFINLEEPGVKLLLEGWEFGADDSLFISCNVTETFASVKHRMGGVEAYSHVRLEPQMHCNILVRKASPMIAKSESDLAIIGEIIRRATVELDLQTKQIMVEYQGQVYTPKTITEKKETF